MPLNKQSPPTVLFTVDVEDWFQVENFRPWIHPESWPHRELRVERNVQRLLELLEGYEATFFVLGWIADRLPTLVRRIADLGHEVASHGENHCLNTALSREELTRDLVVSKKRLEDITGQPVTGYRAPSFAISDAILESVQLAGYRYDSSYNSFALNSRYGKLENKQDGTRRTIFEYRPGFYEIPLSNLAIGSTILPWSGGGYFRLYPIAAYIAGIKYHLRRHHSYTFYLHPWEIDPAQPVVAEAGRVSKFRHYLNLDKTRHRITRLLNGLKHCRFMNCCHHVMEYRANARPMSDLSFSRKTREEFTPPKAMAVSS